MNSVRCVLLCLCRNLLVRLCTVSVSSRRLIFISIFWTKQLYSLHVCLYVALHCAQFALNLRSTPTLIWCTFPFLWLFCNKGIDTDLLALWACLYWACQQLFSRFNIKGDSHTHAQIFGQFIWIKLTKLTIWILVSAFAHAHVYTHTHTHICIKYIYMYIRTCVYVYFDAFLYIYIYIYTYIYIYIYIIMIMITI